MAENAEKKEGDHSLPTAAKGGQANVHPSAPPTAKGGGALPGPGPKSASGPHMGAFKDMPPIISKAPTEPSGIPLFPPSVPPGGKGPSLRGMALPLPSMAKATTTSATAPKSAAGSSLPTPITAKATGETTPLSWSGAAPKSTAVPHGPEKAKSPEKPSSALPPPNPPSSKPVSAALPTPAAGATKSATLPHAETKSVGAAPKPASQAAQQPKKELSKPKWSGERAKSSANVAKDDDDSSTTSLLYKAPNDRGGGGSHSSGSSSSSGTSGKSGKEPRPTLSVTKKPGAQPSKTGQKSASKSAKGGGEMSGSSGGGSSSKATSVKPTSTSSSSKPTSAKGGGDGHGESGGGGGGGGGGPGFTLPDLSALPGCQGLTDLWKLLLQQLEHLEQSSYWGVHLLTLIAVASLNAYKNKR